MPDLESLLDRLIQHHVDFVIVGGFAAVAHGSSLMTLDLDVCCAFDQENLTRLGQAIGDLSPVHRVGSSKRVLDLDALPTAGFTNLYLQTTLGQLDCLSELSALGPYAVVKAKSEVVDLGVGSCRVLGLDALIKTKEALNRPRDRAAAAELRAIKEWRDQQS